MLRWPYAKRATIIRVGTFDARGEPVGWQFEHHTLSPAQVENATKAKTHVNYCRWMGWSMNDLREAWHRVRLN